jgi:hypothetical protein
MPAWLISFLVQYVLPAAVEFFMAFLKNLQSAHADDPTVLSTVEQIVSAITVDHPDWSGEQKRSFALSAIKQRFSELGKEVGDSLINTLVELAVQKQKAAVVPAAGV